MITQKIFAPVRKSTYFPPVVAIQPHVQSLWEKGRSQWPKLRFDQFITKTRERYKVGDIVTLASLPVNENIIPAVIYRISYIEEFWYQVDYDEVLLEPKAILVSSPYVQYPLTKLSPQRIRHLSEGEAKLDNAFNKVVVQPNND